MFKFGKEISAKLIEPIFRLSTSPLRLFWIVKFKLKHPWLPLDLIPSYEHRSLPSLIDDPDLIIDVGFNKGQFSSLAFSHWPSVHIVAADPTGSTIEHYVESFKSAYPANFYFCGAAVSSRIGTGLLNLAMRSANHSLLSPTQQNLDNHQAASLTGQVLDVELITLDSLIDRSGFSGSNGLLKIDAQGAEYEILRAITPRVQSAIRWVYVELSDSMYSGQGSRSDIIELLSQMNYTFVADVNAYRSTLNGSLTYTDTLFVRK